MNYFTPQFTPQPFAQPPSAFQIATPWSSGPQPLQHLQQVLHALPQQIQQLQALQQLEVQYLQQLLQIVPAQLQQLQQLVQIIPQQPFLPPTFAQGPNQVM